MLDTGLLRFADVASPRSAPWQNYLSAQRPRRNQDRWKYTPLALLRDLDFVLKSPRNDDVLKVFPDGMVTTDTERPYQICFEDGLLTSANLPAWAKLSTLTYHYEPKPKTSELLRAEHVNEIFNLAIDKIEAVDQEEMTELLALAIAPEFYCLTVDNKDEFVTSPAELPHIYVNFRRGADSDHRQLTATSLSYMLLDKSKALVVERVEKTATGQGTILHQLTDIAPGASLKKVCSYESNENIHMTCGASRIAAQGEFQNIALYRGVADEGYRRHHHRACLVGPEAVFRGVGFTRGQAPSFVDWQWSINHLAPDSKSYQQVRSVLERQARTAFHGMIYIAPDCPGSEGYQEARGLLQDETSSYDCIPALKIFTDAVKCSHGAVVSPLAKDMVFYLTSRGISRPVAEQLLVQGFFREIVADIYDKTFADGGAIYRTVKDWVLTDLLVNSSGV